MVGDVVGSFRIYFFFNIVFLMSDLPFKRIRFPLRGQPMKNKEQPHGKYAFLKSPRCGAKTRSGTPCKSPAMANGRCRMHGGKSTGPPRGNQNALKHGFYTREAIEGRRYIRQLLKASQDLLNNN
jgi:hypothetical protein